MAPHYRVFVIRLRGSTLSPSPDLPLWLSPKARGVTCTRGKSESLRPRCSIPGLSS